MDAREVPGGSGYPDLGLQQANAFLPVELVPSRRGGFKAKYGGFTFNMETSRGSRRHWHCDVRGCKSRLTTDDYGGDHVVFKLAAHNEDVHERAAGEKKRRRSEAAFRQQPTRKIGDFSYILEDHIGDQYCWRCKYVQCKGKCRTDIDGRLVFGPTKHTCIQLASNSSPREQPLSSQHTPASPRKGVADTSTDANAHQRQQHVENADISEDSCGSQGRKSAQGLPPRKKVRKLDSSDSDDEDDERSRRGDDEEDEGNSPRSRSRGGGRSNMAAIGSMASAARVLETMSGSCSCAQNKILAAVYQGVYGLLLKEQNLLKVQMRNELQRGRLLKGQMKDEPSTQELFRDMLRGPH